jgi:DNA-directed RNA polymerase specialized sigma24 family protein
MRAIGRASLRVTPPTDPFLGDRYSVRERLATALARCDAQQRMVLSLLLVERMTAEEVAGTLGLTVRDVSRIRNAMFTELRGVAATPLRRLPAA